MHPWDPQAFQDTLQALRQGGPQYSWMAPEPLPLLGVGHSNGALLHLLVGAMCKPAYKGNVIISFNNKCVRLLGLL